MIKRLLILLYLCSSFTGVIQTIPDTDKITLGQLREEEKLSRDLYQVLNSKWNHTVFRNISQAEAMHMDELKNLMDHYDVKDPVMETGDKRGKFVDEDFQRLYDSLVASGSTSLEQAFRAGALVEENGIQDLREAKDLTEVKDLAAIYTYLIMASEQHLRAFSQNLKRLGVIYTPVLMSIEEYDHIVGSGIGRGRMSGRMGN